MTTPPIRRRSVDPISAAEAVFRKTAAPPIQNEPAPAAGAVPNARELVSVRVDRDVLDYFQQEGPGWQDRMNAALRKAAGL